MRIENAYQLNELFQEEHQSIAVELFRDGKKISKTIRSKDITQEIIKREDEIIHEVCTRKSHPKNNALCL